MRERLTAALKRAPGATVGEPRIRPRRRQGVTAEWILDILGGSPNPMGPSEIGRAIERRHGVAVDESTVRHVLSRSKQAAAGRFRKVAKGRYCLVDI